MTAAPKAEEVIAEALCHLADPIPERLLGFPRYILAALRAAAPDGDGEAVVLVDRPGAPIVRWIDESTIAEVLVFLNWIAGVDRRTFGSVSDQLTALIEKLHRFAEPAPDRTTTSEAT